MRICKAGYFWLVFIAITLGCVVLSCPYALFCKLTGLAGRDSVYFLRKSTWMYARCLFFLLRPILKVYTERPDIALKNSPCIIVLNHQSFLDSYLLCMQSCQNLCFVVADWPFKKLFFFAPIMRMCKYVRTAAYSDKEQFMEACGEVLAKGGTLVCFPEGTRSRTGNLQGFHSGIFRVSVATGARIVPMVLYNSGRVCRPGSLMVYPQPVFISLLEPLSARRDLSPRQACHELKERVRNAVTHQLSVYSGR
jgi:1-acyl-sn-glycerol-3-phosphate acyltransferase